MNRIERGRLNPHGPILAGCLEERDCRVAPSHKQQAKRTRAAVARNGRRRLLQVDPFKRAILPHQILNVLELLFIHSGIGDEQDAPVNVFDVLKRPLDILFRRVQEIARLHAADHHPALFQHKHRMQQQRVAEDLNVLRYPPGLAHDMGAVDDKSRGNETLHPSH